MSSLSFPAITEAVLPILDPPVLKIKSDFDVEAWKSTSAYKYYGTFLRQLNESVVGYSLPLEDGASDSEVWRLSSRPERLIKPTRQFQKCFSC